MAGYWDSPPSAECTAWAKARKLSIAAKPKWYADVFLDVLDEPAASVYWGDRDTRFHIQITAPEWSTLFVHGGKSSQIRVRPDERLAHGADEWKQLKQVPKLAEIGSWLAKLEKKYRVTFRRDMAYVRTNLTGGKKILRAWAMTL